MDRYVFSTIIDAFTFDARLSTNCYGCFWSALEWLGSSVYYELCQKTAITWP